MEMMKVGVGVVLFVEVGVVVEVVVLVEDENAAAEKAR